MPILILSFSLLASVARQTRSNMLESSARTISAPPTCGRPRKSMALSCKHALKKCGDSIITTIGMQVRVVVGGSLMVEQVFNIAGIGTLLVSAVNGRDYMVVQGCVFMISLVTVAVNFLIDLLYGVVDPRIVSLGGKENGGKLQIKCKRTFVNSFGYSSAAVGLQAMLRIDCSVCICALFA